MINEDMKILPTIEIMFQGPRQIDVNHIEGTLTLMTTSLKWSMVFIS